MINFRFHLVSITAIFLALAAGIAIGAAVVDQGSVNLLRDQIDEVEARRQETNARNDELKLQLDEWQRYADQAGSRLFNGSLAEGEGGIPVVLVAIDGVDRAQVGAVAEAMTTAGAAFQGTLYLGPKWALPDDEAADQLAEALGIGADLSNETIRRASIARLGRALMGGDAADLLVSLQQRGFVEHLAPELGPSLPAVPTPDAVVVFITGPGAKLSKERFVVPLVDAMADAERPFVVAQPGAPQAGTDRASAVAAVRTTPELAARVTTVDSIHEYRGRVAAVLAVASTRAGAVGHYGLGAGAERIVPEVPQPAGQ